MKRSFFFLLIVLAGTFPGLLVAQTNPNEYVEEKPVLMKNEATGGLNFHTGSWGIEFRRCYNQTGYKKLMFEGDFIGMKHSKEVKTVNQRFDNARSYVYGKLNTFNILRLGAGQQYTLFSKWNVPV